MIIAWSGRGTAWYLNNGEFERARSDQVLSLVRVYSREGRDYMWQIYIGRLLITFGTFK